MKPARMKSMSKHDEAKHPRKKAGTAGGKGGQFDHKTQGAAGNDILSESLATGVIRHTHPASDRVVIERRPATGSTDDRALLLDGHEVYSWNSAQLPQPGIVMDGDAILVGESQTGFRAEIVDGWIQTTHRDPSQMRIDKHIDTFYRQSVDDPSVMQQIRVDNEHGVTSVKDFAEQGRMYLFPSTWAARQRPDGTAEFVQSPHYGAPAHVCLESTAYHIVDVEPGTIPNVRVIDGVATLEGTHEGEHVVAKARAERNDHLVTSLTFDDGTVAWFKDGQQVVERGHDDEAFVFDGNVHVRRAGGPLTKF